MAVALILGATQLIMLGLFGLYLKSIFLEVKNALTTLSVVLLRGKVRKPGSINLIKLKALMD